MSIASPQNRDEFKSYIKMRLGAPVLEINVADEQMDIAINDAFQFFHERNHFNGVERGYLTFTVDEAFKQHFRTYSTIPEEGTDDDPNAINFRVQNNYITLPDDVVGVVRIMRKRGVGLGGGIVPGGMLFPLLLGGITGGGCDNQFNLVSYYAMQEFLALLEWMLYPPKTFNFNQRTHRMVIDGDLREVATGSFMCIEVMLKPNPDLYPDLWNDLWLKDYSTALVKRQWGLNLTKYAQVQLPGGIVMNGDRILQDANQEIATLKERFSMDWADIPLDMVG